jgi:hypothetical protein
VLNLYLLLTQQELKFEALGGPRISTCPILYKVASAKFCNLVLEYKPVSPETKQASDSAVISPRSDPQTGMMMASAIGSNLWLVQYCTCVTRLIDVSKSDRSYVACYAYIAAVFGENAYRKGGRWTRGTDTGDKNPSPTL